MASRQLRPAGAKPRDANPAEVVIADRLEQIARQGARQMLMSALNEEVDQFLGRGRCERKMSIAAIATDTRP